MRKQSDRRSVLQVELREFDPVGNAQLHAIRAAAQAIKAARRTVVVSSGSGTGPAHVLGYLGTIMGCDIQLALGSSTGQAAQVARLQEGDCLVVLNIWRLTRAIRGLARVGRERGATVCVLTDLRSSPLADDAHHLIATPIEGIQAGPSLTAMVAAVQAILAEMADDDSARVRRRPEGVERPRPHGRPALGRVFRIAPSHRPTWR
ncbi:SIS domain-containing protein [Saccharopolyspora sp. NPDC050642]|uniref:MurR/RpiR family transcriptional regulator n=1 Tax=Saccharopolyspora sp. NPDC050642 TaxID=3157099 RepID=UPI0033DDBA8D